MQEKLDALKGREVVIYLRVSTDEQTGTLKEQEKTVREGLKALGYKGKITVFAEQESGGVLNRKELLKAIAEVTK